MFSLRRLLLCVLILCPVLAHAQSTGGFQAGHTLSAGSLNSVLSGKVDTVGGSLSSPTIIGGSSVGLSLSSSTIIGGSSVGLSLSSPTIIGGSSVGLSLTNPSISADANLSPGSVTATGGTTARSLANSFGAVIVSAAGATQGTATTVSVYNTIVTSGAAGTGVIVAAGIPSIHIINRNSTGVLVYPPSGAQLESYGTNNPIQINPGGDARFICPSSSQCEITQ